ncbi:PEP-CTERM sorting domain-containing protein [Leptothrix discophora]|uniref:PEP-CTERM sorting domain-containing protein n=1 Tax=Leptothrix discophora TaxID=89 RepID=A0ABT9FXW4_LEPDI|nr:PEP-CTERM sorting domain-containing protein [Leptothrix discophora]MDP4299074.1 PEP-CTERM sorting domain-containing protein [Leptothrix discophora]
MFKKLIVAAAIAVGSLGAHAAPVDTTVNAEVDGNANVNLLIGSFSALAALNDVVINFSLFTMPSFGFITGNTISPTLQVSLSPTGGSQALGTGTPGGAYAMLGLINGNLTNFSSTFSGVAGGNYAVRLVDSANPANNLVAATNFSANVTAVPEPETYAMLLAGLGAIGFMSRRRKAGAV